MDDLNEKEPGAATLDRVTGGNEPNSLHLAGHYRCTVCGWENPNKGAPIPKVLTCRKCGGRMQWYEIQDEA